MESIDDNKMKNANTNIHIPHPSRTKSTSHQHISGDSPSFTPIHSDNIYDKLTGYTLSRFFLRRKQIRKSQSLEGVSLPAKPKDHLTPVLIKINN